MNKLRGLTLRTDESFQNREDPGHHVGGEPPLEKDLNIPHVSEFHLDPMHMFYLGVPKRFLERIFLPLGKKVQFPVNIGNSKQLESLNQ